MSDLHFYVRIFSKDIVLKIRPWSFPRGATSRIIWTWSKSSYNSGRNQHVAIGSDWTRFFYILSQSSFLVILHVQFINSLWEKQERSLSLQWGFCHRNSLCLSLSAFRRSSILARRDASSLIIFTKARAQIVRLIRSSSSGRRGSLMSTSRWRSSNLGFVIIRRYRGRSRSFVWPVAIAVCRRWNP